MAIVSIAVTVATAHAMRMRMHMGHGTCTWAWAWTWDMDMAWAWTWYGVGLGGAAVPRERHDALPGRAAAARDQVDVLLRHASLGRRGIYAYMHIYDTRIE